MRHILACIDASLYAGAVCDLAAWISRSLGLPVELLHVMQRQETSSVGADLTRTISIGEHSTLLETLLSLDESAARFEVERGRLLMEACEEQIRAAGAVEVIPTHRHGAIVETILEREADARVIVMGKRGVSHFFAQDHIGSKLESVVRATQRAVVVAPLQVTVPPTAVVLAYDGSPAAKRALERCAYSPLFRDLPVQLVLIGPNDRAHRQVLDQAMSMLPDRDVATILEDGELHDVVSGVVRVNPGAMVLMGAYGHTPLRTLLVGSTTAAAVRSIDAPIALTR